MLPSIAAAGLCALFTLSTSIAQTYPAKPVRLVVGFAAGGATDIAARVLSQKLSENLGQTVIVDNRPGASGNVAAEQVARSAGDGYTIFMANATVAIPSLFSNLRYDVRKDFAPVSLVGHGPSALSVHPSLPVKSLRDVVTLARRKPGALNYSSGGSGNITHLAMELFTLMSKVQMVHVPYKGGAPSALAVATGEAELCFCTVAAAVAHFKSGKMRALAVSSARRSAALPNVPTVAESGLPGYEASSWYALLAPVKTPSPVLGTLSQNVVSAVQSQATQSKLIDLGIEPADAGPAALSAYMASELAKWEKVVREAKIPPQ